MSRFITVLVEPSTEIPEGCCLRFRAAGEPFAVARLRYSDGMAPPATYQVYSRGPASTLEPARACLVDDSGSGSALLVYGGSDGLLLVAESGDATIVEPYLLIDPSDPTPY